MQAKRQTKHDTASAAASASTSAKKTLRLWLGATIALTGLITASGCHTDMWRQPKVLPYVQSDFFADKQSARPLVEGTIPQGGERLQEPALFTGYENGKPVRKIPPEAVRAFGGPTAMLSRGQEQYNIYCTPCHGFTGDGNGMITRRGLEYLQKRPASYHTDKLRKIEDGHIFDVITNGHQVMYGYASRIQNVSDRWAIVAYVRALQASRDLTPAQAGMDAETQVQKSGGRIIEPAPETAPPGNNSLPARNGDVMGGGNTMTDTMDTNSGGGMTNNGETGAGAEGGAAQ